MHCPLARLDIGLLRQEGRELWAGALLRGGPEPLGWWCRSSLQAERCLCCLICPGVHRARCSLWCPSVHLSGDSNRGRGRLSSALGRLAGLMCVCCSFDNHKKFYIITFRQTLLV